MRRRMFISTGVAWAAPVNLSMRRAISLPVIADFTESWAVEVSVANPVAGSGAFFTVPSGWAMKITCIEFLLTCSAAAANRSPIVFCRSESLVLWVAAISTAVVAAGTSQTTFSVGTSVFSQLTGFLQGSLPDVIVPSGSVIEIDAANFQAGDTVANVVLHGIAYPRPL